MNEQTELCRDCDGQIITSIFEGEISSFYSVDFQCDCNKKKLPPKYLDKVVEDLLKNEKLNKRIKDE